MVFLDVVYNHFGPEGNYLSTYAKSFFTERHHTPWGAAINFDGKDARPVRDYFINNALYWLNEYRFDGLRFDAVHAIIDDSKPHILTELAETVRRKVEAATPAATSIWCWKTKPIRRTAWAATTIACRRTTPRSGTTISTTPRMRW